MEKQRGKKVSRTTDLGSKPGKQASGQLTCKLLQLYWSKFGLTIGINCPGKIIHSKSLVKYLGGLVHREYIPFFPD